MKKAFFFFVVLFLNPSCRESPKVNDEVDVLKIEEKQNLQKKDEEFGLSTIGELPLEKSIVEMIRVFINQPFGGSNYVVKMYRYPNNTLICKKEVTGYGLNRSYQETCNSLKPSVHLDSLWDKSVFTVLQHSKDLNQSETGNDDWVAQVELAKGIENLSVELSICTAINWPIVLAEDILSDRIALPLPECYNLHPTE
ncbi:hypothetical protein [Neolewinella agarilytica]|uniref:Uncharacterized protein n=1 Tax=Neolewinella agarilytica TaxID=478744 RepID=A0A1H9PKP0_9BACT|nr:hypothetical protein [Neolewinella agarilytica]SER48395.1 hypothetical protein SAMN05444359_1572 [Neolewinella agarilytica]